MTTESVPTLPPWPPVTTEQNLAMLRPRSLDPNLSDHLVATDNIATLMPQLFVHASDRFRPITIEQALSVCRWKGRDGETQTVRQIVDDETPLTLDYMRHVVDTEKWQWNQTFLEPKPKALATLHAGPDWTHVPLYVQTRLKTPLEGHLVCTYLWSGRKACSGPFSSVTVLDVGVMVASIYRYDKTREWRLSSLELPRAHAIVPRVPSQLYLARNSHHICLEVPCSGGSCCGCGSSDYEPLWRPRIERLPSGAAPSWLDLHNFHVG